MKTLSALLERESFEVPPFALDHFQKKVREGLHLEFFLARGRLILTPHLAPLTTAEATAAEDAQVRAILEDRQELLEQVKLYLLFNLSLYSALLETNSHHVAVNDHRVISRFLPYGAGACEVKLYTQPPGDPVERYGDRIYLGRDCLPLDSPRRPHLGLGYLRQSLPEQVGRLAGRLDRHATAAERAALAGEFLVDLQELAEEFAQKADRVLRTYPPEISSRSAHGRDAARGQPGLPRAQARPLRRRDHRARDGGEDARGGLGRRALRHEAAEGSHQRRELHHAEGQRTHQRRGERHPRLSPGQPGSTAMPARRVT